MPEKSNRKRLTKKVQPHKQISNNDRVNDKISLWWILAGVFEIGLLGAPSRISHSSSKHKKWSYIFILLFIFAIVGVVSSYSGFPIVFWVLLALQIIITLGLFLSLRYDDKPFATLSLYIFIGLLVTVLIIFGITYSYNYSSILQSGTSLSVSPGFFIHVNFTVTNTSTIIGSYSSSAPISMAIITQSEYVSWISNQYYTPSFELYSRNTRGGSLSNLLNNTSLNPGYYVLIFENNGTTTANVTIQDSILLERPK